MLAEPLDEREYQAAVRRNHAWLRKRLNLMLSEPTIPVGPKHKPLPPALPPSQVTRRVNQLGAGRPRNPKGGTKFQPLVFAITIDEIKRRLAQGINVAAIAAQEGCTPDLIWRRMRNAGVKPPEQPCVDCRRPTGRSMRCKRCLECDRQHELDLKRERYHRLVAEQAKGAAS